MSFEIVAVCGECGAELARGKKPYTTREEAEAEAKKAGAVSMFNAPRCPVAPIHGGPYGDSNFNVKMEVREA